MDLTHKSLAHLLEEIRPVITEEFYGFVKNGIAHISASIQDKKSGETQLRIDSQFFDENEICIAFFTNYKTKTTKIIIRASNAKNILHRELTSEEYLSDSLVLEALYEASKLYSRVNNLREGNND